MDVEIKVLNKHRFRMIAVAQQNLGGKMIFDIDCLVFEGRRFKVHDKFTFERGDSIVPGGLMLLAFGQKVEAEKIWNKYPNSERIYFFVCEELN